MLPPRPEAPSKTVPADAKRDVRKSADVEIDSLRGIFAVSVQRFQMIGSGLTESGSLILSEPLGSGDEIVATRSGNRAPLALSTRTTWALTIRFRYVAEITRFSYSTKLITGFIFEINKIK
jgi:hypothetical protein